MTVKRRRGIGCSRTIPSNDLRASRWEVTFGCSTIFDLTHDHNQLKMLCSKHFRSAIACYFYFYTICCMYPLQMLVLCRLCQWLDTGLVCVKWSTCMRLQLRELRRQGIIGYIYVCKWSVILIRCNILNPWEVGMDWWIRYVLLLPCINLIPRSPCH